MAHYFVVAGEEDFDRYKRDYAQALVDKNVLRGVIARSLEIKKSYIEIDEYDKNERQVFNYGHSFGHAIESLTNYENSTRNSYFCRNGYVQFRFYEKRVYHF